VYGSFAGSVVQGHEKKLEGAFKLFCLVQKAELTAKMEALTALRQQELGINFSPEKSRISEPSFLKFSIHNRDDILDILKREKMKRVKIERLDS